MKRKNIHTPLICLLAATMMLASLPGCEDLAEDPELEPQLVLNAYLFEDEPVTFVHLKESLPFSSPDTVFPVVSDASISITWEDQVYSLQPSDSAGYYHCADTNLQIMAGAEYAIEVLHGEERLYAETSVPAKPDSLKLSVTSIAIDPDLTPFELRQSGVPEIEVTWANPSGDYFYVLVENMEEDPEDILSGFSDFLGRRNFRFLSQPFITDTYIIRLLLSVQQFGTHRVRLYRVNQEYADLYENREQDSRNLTEPLSNVDGGLGIFTAFSYDVAYFEVKKD